VKKARKKRSNWQRFLRAFFFVCLHLRVFSTRILSGSEVSSGEIYGTYLVHKKTKAENRSLEIIRFGIKYKLMILLITSIFLQQQL